MSRQLLKRIPAVAWANAACQARLQEWEAASNLERCRREAVERRITCPDTRTLGEQLRRRLSARNQGRWPAEKGRLHAFLAYSVSNWETILPRSLEPFGRVTAFNWREHGFDDRSADWLDHRDAMNAAMLAAFETAQREQPVDAVIGYLSGHNTSPATLQAMARAGAAIFNFCLDDKLHFPGARLGGRFTSPAALASTVDLNLTNAPESVLKYQVHGGLAHFWPEAAHPEVHCPQDVPFEFDVSFAGTCYGWRPRFIGQLERRGLAVTCFGQGWPRGPLANDEIIRLYSRSRINLGFGGVGHSRKLLCLKARDFEVPMSGGLYLTQHNPELAAVFSLGSEIVTYVDAADCAARIRELLANPERAAAIRRAGLQRCREEHTYEARWSEAFALAGLLTSTKGKCP